MKASLIVFLTISCLVLANAQTPRRATATATVVGGFVVGVTVTDGGDGYTNAPPVHVFGGGGSNALLTASFSNGVVTTVTVNNPGSSYATTPSISIAPPVVPLAQLSVSPATDLLFTNLAIYASSVSAGYFLMKNISGEWVNQQPMFGAGGTFIASYDGTYPVSFDEAVPAGKYALGRFPIPIQAAATAQVVNGFVTGITITGYGMGYTSPPPVQIIGGGGSGALAQASITPAQYAFPTEVSSITVLNPGAGYTSTPTVVIGPPNAPLRLASPIVTPKVRLSSGNLETNLTYQLLTSPDLETWTSAGPTFLASSPSNLSYVYPTNSSGFFRLRYVP